MKFQTVCKTFQLIRAKTNYSIMHLLIDYCKNKNHYGININDYNLYEFYNLDISLKENILTYQDNKKLIDKYNKNSKEYNYQSKKDFYKKYNSIINRHWLELTGKNITEFSDFITKYPTIISSKNDINSSTELISPDQKNYTKLYNDLVLSNKLIIEEPLIQIEPLKSLNEDYPSIIRTIILNEEIIYAYLIVKNKEDNLYAPINIETGIIDYPACNSYQTIYDINPQTNKSIYWLSIPKWPRTKRLALKAADKNPNIKYLEIDIVMTTNGPTILKINPNVQYQLIELINLVNKIKSLKNIIKEREN